MKFRRGEIYYIHKSDFAKSCGSEQYAGRPAIIVSNYENNAFSQTLEVVFLTTQEKSKLPTHVQIHAAKKDSTAICEQITTVSVDRVGNYFGMCSDCEMEEIDRALRISLGLSSDEATPDPDAHAVEDNVHIEEIIRLQAERDIFKRMYENLLSGLGVKV